MTMLQDEDRVLAGEDLPHDRAMAMLRDALHARNHFSHRVGQLLRERALRRPYTAQALLDDKTLVP